MADRKITYTVEIDASQAQAAARVLRAIFESELKAIQSRASGGMGGANGGQLAGLSAAPAQQMKRALEELGRVDLTRPADALQEQLADVERTLQRTRREWERLNTLASATQTTVANRMRQTEYVADVRRFVSDEAATAISTTGRALNIGQRGAEFKVDEEGYYIEAAQDAAARQEQVTEKQRFTAQEKEELLRLELEMYDAELQGVRIQQELARRRLSTLEGTLSGQEITATNAALFDEAERAEREARELAENEESLLRTISRTNDELGDLLQAEAKKAARSAGQITAAALPPATGATGYTSQTAITVSQRSVENAEKLAAALHEAADASRRIEASRTSAGVREFEMGLERERQAIRAANELRTAQSIEAAKAQAAAQRAEIAKATEAARAAEHQKTAVARAEAAQRMATARAEAAVAGEASRTARMAATEEEKRRTAAYMSELRRRETAQQKSAPGGLPFGISGTSLMYGAMGALGVYSLDQVVRTGLDWGRQGAQQMRMAETFEALAQRTGQSSQKIVAAIRQASQETITDMDAMGLAAQVLSQKWAGSITTLDTDIATVVAASRRYSQIFTDEQGKMLTTQEVFARLIKFSREGNKELVDQFGLSNQRIAQALGISVQGLASATGATDRWRGMVQLLNEDLQRLGQANITTADEIEQSAARIEAARQRIQRGLAGPAAGAYEFGADVIEGLTIELPTTQMQQRIDELQSRRKPNALLGITPEQVEETYRRFELLKMALEQVADAQLKGAQGANEYAARLNDVYSSATLHNNITDEQLQLLIEINNWFVAAESGADAYANAIANAGAASATTADRMDLLSDATADMSGDLRALAMVAASAGADIDNLGAAVDGLQARMGAALAPLAEFNAESQRVGGALLSQAQRAVELVGPQRAGEILQQQLSSFEEIQAGLRRQGVTAGPEMRLTMEEALLQLSQPFTDIQEAERARIEAQREWERAAERTASEMERAAERMVDEFKSGLQQVPGLFGGSGVTAEQMRLAEAGVGQNFADDYLRRLRDEVLNKKDWAGVDIGDAAQRAGIDPSLPADIILTLFEQAWNDQSLFAGGKNIDLINRDAVTAGLAKQDASKSGQAALFAAFGVPVEPSAQLAQFAGGAVQATGEQLAAGVQPAALLAGVPTLDGAAMLEEMTKAMEAGLDGNIKDRLYAVGEGIVASVHQGFSDAVANLEWGGQIIDNLAAALVGPLFDALSAEL